MIKGRKTRGGKNSKINESTSQKQTKVGETITSIRQNKKRNQEKTSQKKEERGEKRNKGVKRGVNERNERTEVKKGTCTNTTYCFETDNRTITNNIHTYSLHSKQRKESESEKKRVSSGASSKMQRKRERRRHVQYATDR